MMPSGGRIRAAAVLHFPCRRHITGSSPILWDGGTMDRRTFLGGTAALALAAPIAARADGAAKVSSFSTRHTNWQTAYDKALAVLAGNVRAVAEGGKPVLIEGSVYNGIWMECGPL